MPQETETPRIHEDSLNKVYIALAEINRSSDRLRDELAGEDERIAKIVKPMLIDAAARLAGFKVFPQQTVMNSNDFRNGPDLEDLLFITRVDYMPRWSTQEFYLNPQGQLLRLARITSDDKNPWRIYKPYLREATDHEYRKYGSAALDAVQSRIRETMPEDKPYSKGNIDIGQRLISGTGTDGDVQTWLKNHPHG